MHKILKNIAGELSDCLDSIHVTHSYTLRELSPCELEDDFEKPRDMEGSEHEDSGENPDDEPGDASLSELLAELFEESIEAPFENFCGGLFDDCDDEGDGEGDRLAGTGKFEGWDLIEKKRYEILDDMLGPDRPIAHMNLARYYLDEVEICHLSADASSLFATSAEGEIARHDLLLVAELLNEHIGKHFEDARIFHYVDFGCTLFSTVEIERFLPSDDPSLLAERISELAAEIVRLSNLMKGICDFAEAVELRIPKNMPLKEKIHHD